MYFQPKVKVQRTKSLPLAETMLLNELTVVVRLATAACDQPDGQSVRRGALLKAQTTNIDSNEVYW